MLVVSASWFERFVATVEKKLGSSLTAAASSFRVSSTPGALSINASNAAAASAVKYVKLSQRLLPSPILNLFVSISKPSSPGASIGLAAVHVAAVPLRCCILVAIFISP